MPICREQIFSTADLRDLDELEHRARTVFAELAQDPSTYGIIHADYTLGNVHLSRPGGAWRTGVIDFDDRGSGFFLYDLGTVLGNCFSIPICGAP